MDWCLSEEIVTSLEYKATLCTACGALGIILSIFKDMADEKCHRGGSCSIDKARLGRAVRASDHVTARPDERYGASDDVTTRTSGTG